jgi:hypothetical protein
VSTEDIDFIKMDVKSRIQDIEAAMLQQDPKLPVHLANIHSSLIKYEELVHLLDDAEIKILIAGTIKHTGNKLTEEITKAKKSTVSSRIPKTSVDDL